MTIYRNAYKKSPYLIPKIDLQFELDATCTVIRSELLVENNPEFDQLADHQDEKMGYPPLCLNGQDIELLKVFINDEPYRQYEINHDGIIFHDPPKRPFRLQFLTQINPQNNTHLLGLYTSNGGLFTQCEAEGFRRITYFLDRPDILSLYRVRLIANAKQYPILLSNGNLLDQGILEDGRHFALWEDPFPKPCYLFAIVAANLACREHRYTDTFGNEKCLQVWSEPHQIAYTEFAMSSLIRAIEWDEKRFGLPLDLDRYMIVAVSDFNAGAMENKGLNLFNSKYVLASPDLATDDDYSNILSIIGHEYFHNWTGNRITCRDWFQLSLKEGLTVFRDQEFSSDMMETASGRVVNRILNVRYLKQMQFPEDSGPMAHPIRPDSYQEISNFYTMTVYEKGAEVVRIYHTILGEEGFQKGLRLYFQRHDGQACTCEQFLAAMADANGIDLGQMLLWYSQAGTPKIIVHSFYDSEKQTYRLTFTQVIPNTNEQSKQKPMLIPCVMGLLSPDGDSIILNSQSVHSLTSNHRQATILLKEEEQSFEFKNISQKPVPSLFRNFSAPVNIEYAYTDDELALIAKFDSDGYNRWDAISRLATNVLLSEGQSQQLDKLIEIYERILMDTKLAPAFKALLLTLPNEGMLADQLVTDKKSIDPQAIHSKKETLEKQIATELFPLIHNHICIYLNKSNGTPYEPTEQQAGERALKHVLCHFFAQSNQADMNIILTAFDQANNLTDRLGYLKTLAHSSTEGFQQKMEQFYKKFHHEPLILDRWFGLQVLAADKVCPEKPTDYIQQLLNHPEFVYTNPNRVRSVLSTYFYQCPGSFHLPDGSGYQLWYEQILHVDQLIPQLSARLARSLEHWRNFSQPYRLEMQRCLLALKSHDLSRDLREIISKVLDS